MTLFPALRQELLDTLGRAQADTTATPASPTATGRRWGALPLIAVVALGGAGIATAAVVALPGPDVDRPPTPVVEGGLTSAFAILRDRPASPVPADVAEQLGLKGGPRGKNLELARSFATSAGTALVIPAEDSLCIAASPAPGIGYAMSCASRAEALAQGVEVRFERTDGSSTRVLVVPDGARVWKVRGSAREPVELTLGTASVRTKSGEHLEVDG